MARIKHNITEPPIIGRNFNFAELDSCHDMIKMTFTKECVRLCTSFGNLNFWTSLQTDQYYCSKVNKIVRHFAKCCYCN